MFILLGKTVHIDGGKGNFYSFQTMFKEHIFLSSRQRGNEIPESFQRNRTVFVFEVHFSGFHTGS